MKMTIKGEEIKLNGSWKIKSGKDVPEKLAHSILYRSCSDNRVRAFDKNLKKWFTYEETNDPLIRELLRPFEITDIKELNMIKKIELLNKEAFELNATPFRTLDEIRLFANKLNEVIKAVNEIDRYLRYTNNNYKSEEETKL